MHDCIGIQQLFLLLGAKCGVTFVFITESQNNGDKTSINIYHYLLLHFGLMATLSI